MERRPVYLTIVSCSILLASCVDPSLGTDPSQDQPFEADEWEESEGELDEKGVPGVVDPALNLVLGGLTLLGVSDPIIGVIGLIPSALGLGTELFGEDEGLSDRAIQQIAEQLQQSRLIDAKWRIESAGGELADAEAVYLRYECVTKKSKPCSTMTVMFNNALKLHGAASAVFRDISSGTTALGYEKLQLVPLLIHSGSAMVFAHHELGLAERALNASKTDLENRQAKMAEAATTVLMALDEAEDLYDEFVRSKFGEVAVRKVRAGCLRPGPRGCASYRYNHVASVRGPEGTVHNSSALSTEASARADMELRLARLKNDYRTANSKTVFTASYADARNNLLEFAAKNYLGIFRWSNAGPISGMYCTQITEGGEPAAHTWGDNYFCASRNLTMRWSERGALRDLRCTLIHEGADPHGWSDNHLCLPSNSPWTLRWSNAGPITGKICTRWNEEKDPHTWTDNYLCVDPR